MSPVPSLASAEVNNPPCTAKQENPPVVKPVISGSQIFSMQTV